MSKEIDINNEEEILKECDFDYFYGIENCSRELCMFYNDIQHQNAGFNCKQAHIDLGRIAITLNKQSQRIAELEKQLAEKDKLIGVYADEHAMLQCKIADLAVKEIKAEKFAINILEELDGSSNYINSKLDFECGFYISQKTVRDKIKELKGD